MATPIGALGHLGLRKESSFASGGAVDNWQPFTSESIVLNYANIYSDRIRSTAEQVDGQRGLEAVTESVTFPVSPNNPTQWWTCGLGQATSPFYVERPTKSMLMQIDRETAAVQVSGATINTMTLSSSQGGELTCVVDVEAAGMASVTAGSPSFTASDAPYLHQEASFLIGGSADTSITAWSVTLNNNAITDLYGTGRQRMDIPASKLQVTGSFTKLFDDTTERNTFLAGTVRSFWVKFSRANKYFTVFCNKVRYDTHPENIGSQSEYILETFNWTAYVDDPSTEYSVRISGG